MIIFSDQWWYHFEESWHIKAPLAKVWEGMVHVEDWPLWWDGLISSSSPDTLPVNVNGKRYDTRWRGSLPYSLDVGAILREVCPNVLIRADIHGDIHGVCTCRVQENGRGTHVLFCLHVRTARPLLTLLSPFLKRYFSDNHKGIMVKGKLGFTRYLAERSGR
ncbi:hypothetical protein OOT00_06570 [Desulfobotulus sp. H1]|uniref:Coenzyme Q-binding protein COQ10 START domain-containing protein n=1 Tax=Desulfobotulus pelophilus TaxID=2823377 RepID=A0ABT3N8X7_9BACT|nr:hypothetical protein [Desulfobotulus pelophilus]MCW7753646.1 hypothetical protein [Desulfobotulus pelophilus]